MACRSPPSVAQPPRMRPPSPQVVVGNEMRDSPPYDYAPSMRPRQGSPQVVINTRRDGLNPDYAQSHNLNWQPSWPITSEQEALPKLKVEWETRPHADPAVAYEGFENVLVIELNDFEIYVCPDSKYGGELCSLEYLDVRGKKLWVDGILSMGNQRFYVQKMHIKSYSVSGYGIEDEDSDTEVYIQSQIASQDQQFDIWYLLKAPRGRYKHIQELFSWVTVLGKHVVDYLELQPDGICIGLRSFEKDFHGWLTSHYPKNQAIQQWVNAHEGTDFRKAVHAHIDYISQEVYNLANQELLVEHSLWGDCMRDDHGSIIPQPLVQSNTIVTPHTYACFKNRYFGSKLAEMPPAEEMAIEQENRKRLLGFPAGAPRGRLPRLGDHNHQSTEIRVGEVVSFTPNDEEKRIWREDESSNQWFAFVRDVKPMSNGTQRIYVIWLYRPEDTTISTMDYPVKNELFLSDSCNCNDEAIHSSEVTGRYSIEWFATTFSSEKDYIVRQKYLTESSSFVSLSRSDFDCDCHENDEMKKARTYQRGDTIYIARRGAEFLSPVVVHDIDFKRQDITVRVLLRYKTCAEYIGYLPRTKDIDNELVWTKEFFTVPLRRVGRRCHIRYFTPEGIEQLPYPYNRNGAGDYWVISTFAMKQDSRPHIRLLPAAPSSLLQAPDLSPLEDKNKLPGLSLFSGLGNLDKGLEQSGMVNTKAFVDMCPEAIHTLYANAEDPDKLKLWLGSVDDYLATLLSGKGTKDSAVLSIGEAAVISAGSPCPGFSTLQLNSLSDESLRNASHVTTICSFVDMYRPKWAFLENVVNMASTRKKQDGELVLSQLVACLVSMGYQVQQFIMNAWSYGSCQRRSRLILSISAPGLVPITPPAATHSNPEGFNARRVGELRNGQGFGAQENCLTPFPYVSAARALSHLPDIGNGVIGGCIRHPDHRLWAPMNSVHRTIMQRIPREPQGSGLKEAIQMKLIPSHLIKSRKKEVGKAYQRIKKDGLVSTILTQPFPADARQGGIVHWAQDRPITIEEARKTQGIPVSDVIVGSQSAQMRMIGNAVDRHVSEALSLELRYAVQKSIRFNPEQETNSFVRIQVAGCNSVATATSTQSQGHDPRYLREMKPVLSTSSTTSEDIVRARVSQRDREDKNTTKAWVAQGLLRYPACSQSSLSVLSKRTYEEVPASVDTPGTIKYLASPNPVKKQKREENTSSVSNNIGNPHGLPNGSCSFSPPRSTPTVDSDDSEGRKTRHSGLEVEFTPSVWHRTPEFLTMKARREKERRDSLPYA
ncbi:unnamed protein product [Periconia digitata]|uniref:DNA (cytosine-5-)-methyltransferase n=1 Tax=Periconia digitata TaxID=1303443 RepID=A0A9W4UHX2_9PLEO|nr:unnamed protein product [Periconia digitata]